MNSTDREILTRFAVGALPLLLMVSPVLWLWSKRWGKPMVIALIVMSIIAVISVLPLLPAEHTTETRELVNVEYVDRWLFSDTYVIQYIEDGELVTVSTVVDRTIITIGDENTVEISRGGMRSFSGGTFYEYSFALTLTRDTAERLR